MDLAARLALKARLPRTWNAFWERHGNFTAAQVAAVPVILAGQNVMLCAPTASGKTEAAIAPLIERLFVPGSPPPSRLRVLYLTPTRALVNDLQARLTHPLQALGVRLGIKTGDVDSFRPHRPPDVLLTTPESTDSLLAAHAKLFANLQAIVIDELHVLHGMPRGDQLRVILQRIRRIRQYASTLGDAPDDAIQYVALSATLDDPGAAAAHYFPAAKVVQVPGGRQIHAEHIALLPEENTVLRTYLRSLRPKGWRKVLAFANTRAEVEAYAAAVRTDSPFGDAVFVHYSNIVAQRRREIERQFAEADAAICWASSTLELGIDIGDIDLVMLMGPPGSTAAFLQRIGRGSRRQTTTHVACFARTPLERLLFDALLAQGHAHFIPRRFAFRPSVAIQQIFSLIKQSPTGGVRLAELAQLFAEMLSPNDLAAIVGELQRRGYLQVGRPGEWRAGRRLNDLVDQQMSAQPTLGIHSNVQGSTTRLVAIRDRNTDQIVAHVDTSWFEQPVLTLQGRPVTVMWQDDTALWVTAEPGDDRPANLQYRSTRQLLSYDLARRLPAQLGLTPTVAPFIAAPTGYWWFHWLGDLWGRALLDLLRYHVPASATAQLGLCVQLPDPPQTPPGWTEAQVRQYLEDNYRALEPMVELGPFQHLLPVALRRRAVVEQFDIERFLAAVAVLQPTLAPDTLAADLRTLLSDEEAA